MSHQSHARHLGAPIEVIAELAQGFEGRPDQARLLLQAAASAGADAAKFQLIYADELAAPDYRHWSGRRAGLGDGVKGALMPSIVLRRAGRDPT